MRLENKTKAQLIEEIRSLRSALENLSRRSGDRSEFQEESEDKYRLFFEHANDIVLFHSYTEKGLPDRFLDANASAVRVLGYSLRELRTLTPMAIIAEEERKDVRRAARVLLQSNESLFERTLLTKQGKRIPVEIHSRLFRFQGKPATLSICRDISERKKSEKRLHESEKRYRDLTELLPQTIFEMDTLGNLTYLNATAEKVFGYSRSDVRNGLNLSQLLQPGELKKAREQMQRLLRGEAGTGLEYQALKKDGALVHIAVHNMPVMRDGEHAGWRGTVIDLTERIRMEEALRKSEKKFRSIAENASDFIFIKDRSRKYVFVNQAMKDLVGLSEKDILGKTAESVFGPEQGRIVRKLDDRTFSGETVDEIRCLEVNGVRAHFHTIQTPLDRRNGRVESITGIVRDVTNQVRDQQRLRDSESYLRNVFEVAAVGPWKYDVENDRFEWSRSALEVMGFPEGAAPKTWEDMKKCIHSEDLERILECFNEYRHIGIYDAEHRLIVGGRIKWIKVRAHTESEGAVRGRTTVGVIQDITERKMAENYMLRSEERYRELFNHMRSGVAVYEVIDGGRDFIFKDFNKAGERIDNQKREDLLGKSVFEIRTGIEEFGLIDTFRKVLDTGEPMHHPISVYRDDKLDGWYENYVYLLPSGELVAVFDDVTERKKAEDAVQESEIKFRSLFENTSSMIVLHDMEGNFIDANKRALDNLGYSKDEFLQMSVADMDQGAVERDDPEKRWKPLEKQTNVCFESNLRRKDGTVFPIEIILTEIVIQNQKIIMSVSRDITERKKAEEAAEKHRLELKNLSAQLISIQEEERRHLSQELHDEMGQSLTGVKINLTSIKSSLPEEYSASVHALIDETDQLIEALLKQMHHIALSLRPAMLDDLGLVPTLKWLIEHNRKRWGLKIRFSVSNMEKRLRSDIETALYRIVQESLNNVVKHSRAKSVTVQIKKLKRGVVRLTVKDDGCGFEPARIELQDPASRGIGLPGIRERVSNLGGAFTIRSVIGRGTVLRVDVPESGQKTAKRTIP